MHIAYSYMFFFAFLCFFIFFFPLFFFFFFLMIRRPPRSTLFPTRRSSDLGFVENILMRMAEKRLAARAQGGARSEEHTSELQSRPHLVCRLLLEKKKK